MFAKTGVPVLASIENMAWFEDPTPAPLPPLRPRRALRFADDAGLRSWERCRSTRAEGGGGFGSSVRSEQANKLFDDLAARFVCELQPG
jgi:hypothetical protein